MAKYSGKAPSSTKAEPGRKAAGGYDYKDRNLASMSPEKAQEALQPTDAEPVQMQKRMAGCS